MSKPTTKYSVDFCRTMGEVDQAVEQRIMDEVMQRIQEGIRIAVIELHHRSKAAGWHDNPREVGTMIALIHSELSEALEAHRKDAMDDHLPHRRGIEVELADALIRICDLAGMLELDLAGAVKEKAQYNLTRADHQRATRTKRF